MTDLHLFFDGGTIPTGWTLVSDSGGPFYQRFVRGYSVYGGTGGSETHTHVALMVSCDGPSTGKDLAFTDYPTFASCTHVHGTGVTASASNIPASKSLKVIKYNSGAPIVIPTGAIAVFKDSVPSGWTRYSDYDDKFIYCDHTIDVSHGADTHVHSYTKTGSLGDALQAWWLPELGDVDASNGTHYHSLFVPTDSKSNRPPYLTVLLARSNTDNIIPLGMIGMFDGTPSDWKVLSESEGDFYEKFILPHSSYGTTGGSVIHEHGNISGTSGVSSSLKVGDSGHEVCVAIKSHTHFVHFDIQETSVVPPYINVVFAENLTCRLTATDDSTGTDTVTYSNLRFCTDTSTGAVTGLTTESQCASTDSCLSSETATMVWSFNVSDTCTLGIEGEIVDVLGYATFTDNGVGIVTYINSGGLCPGTDSCIASEYLYKEVAHPWYDTGTFTDKLGQCFAELTVKDKVLYTEYANVYLSLDETVGRMMWRFSTAYDKTSSSNLTTLTAVLASELTKLEFTDILGESNHFVDYASGTSLDYIGALFSLGRKSEESDRNYRMRIKTAPLIAGGTRSSLKTAISTVLGIDEDLISVVDNYKGEDGNYGHITIEFDISEGVVDYDEATFLTIVNRNKAAGVRIDDVKTVEKYTLTFTDDGNGCHRANITETDSLNWVCD